MPNIQEYTISLFIIEAPETLAVLVRYWRDKIELTDELVVEILGGAS